MDAVESFEFLSASPEDTRRLGKVISGCLPARAIIALQGTLGAGKTFLIQCIAESAGVDRAEVTSPSFSLIQQYQGEFNLVHIDAWRIRDEDEMAELGIDELMSTDAVVLIEWADKFPDLIPADCLQVAIKVDDEDQRTFRFSWPKLATRSGQLGRQLRAALGSAS